MKDSGDNEDDDEDDYMSDKYLQGENKPGLMPKLFLDRHKRSECATKKTHKAKKTVSVKAQEIEKRKEKLETPLDESNKGFAMLSKMGFKKGMGLGKEGHGIAEPISIEIKAGRSGLGKDSEEERKRKQRIGAYMMNSKRRKEQEESMRLDFKSRVRNKHTGRQASYDLSKSQRVCEQLDKAKDILQPTLVWYWPHVENEKEDDEEEEEEEEIEIVPSESEILERLSCITNYLRNDHSYCIWCGVTFTDSEDIKTNCPGDTYEIHQD